MNNIVVRIICAVLIVTVCWFAGSECRKHSRMKELVLSKEDLKDRIMGGWAGQTIGVTYGGPYEFAYQGSFIQERQPLRWYDGYLKNAMLHQPGLYDDLYMDLTFVDVIEKYGVHAPADSFANAFAHAGFRLWHANQSARYNILHGLRPPASGNYLNNPHADDIDFQIESDFAGLMSPAMPNTAAQIGDSIGHIMCYGDGWYGGVFISAMYSLAFTGKPASFLVTEALKTIPPASSFYKCMEDVIRWHRQYPVEWQRTWFELQKKWSSEVGCSDGVYSAFNIDAKLNSAYVVLGLLYGNEDFSRSLDIAARAGQDADCNTSTVAGILGTKIGYRNIPSYWKMGLKAIEDIPFRYTDISLNKVYAISYKHALTCIRDNGGAVRNNDVIIKMQQPLTVRLEQSFTGMEPVRQLDMQVDSLTDTSFSFHGTGVLVKGEALSLGNSDLAGDTSDCRVEVYIDGLKEKEIILPVSFFARKNELYWNYSLPRENHTIRLRMINPSAEHVVKMTGGIVYR